MWTEFGSYFKSKYFFFRLELLNNDSNWVIQWTRSAILSLIEILSWFLIFLNPLFFFSDEKSLVALTGGAILEKNKLSVGKFIILKCKPKTNYCLFTLSVVEPKLRTRIKLIRIRLPRFCKPWFGSYLFFLFFYFFELPVKLFMKFNNHIKNSVHASKVMNFSNFLMSVFCKKNYWSFPELSYLFGSGKFIGIRTDPDPNTMLIKHAICCTKMLRKENSFLVLFLYGDDLGPSSDLAGWPAGLAVWRRQ